MGTEKTRRQKIDWMRDMARRIKDEEALIRHFMLVFATTKHTAQEIYNIVKWQKNTKQKTLKI
ncbi:MAG: hypothetical protein ACTSQE_14755 [Candidatus Heimdallarchaeaceae archaeon]